MDPTLPNFRLYLSGGGREGARDLCERQQRTATTRLALSMTFFSKEEAAVIADQRERREPEGEGGGCFRSLRPHVP